MMRSRARHGPLRARSQVALVVLLLGALTLAPHAARGHTPSVPSVTKPSVTNTGAWTTVGAMHTHRGFQTATLLPNGQVLVAGGENPDPPSYGTLSSAELYNPATGTWTPTGALTFAAEQSTATLLRTGKVLVAGGALYDTSATNQADLYDPATGTFTSTGSMVAIRADQTATLLRDGQVLITGGCDGIYFGCQNTWNGAELYDPTTGSFTATGTMMSRRQWHTATLLPSGKVLIAGGAICAVCYSLASAELYDPATGTFTATGTMTTPRQFHTATLLRNGQVLVTGGCTLSGGNCAPSAVVASAELYNPRTGTWTATGSMTTPRYDHTATLLPSGQVLIAGGANNQGSTQGQPLASAELYNPATGTFTSTASMAVPRDIHTATLLRGGGVLVAGGCVDERESCAPRPVLASAEVYTAK